MSRMRDQFSKLVRLNEFRLRIILLRTITCAGSRQTNTPHVLQARDVEQFDVLGCLPPPLPDYDHPDAPRNLRGMVRDLLRSNWWESLVFAAVVVSSILLALQVGATRPRTRRDVQHHFCMFG
jgi:hypothetical protein